MLESVGTAVTVIGEGSNLIAADAGFSGAVLRLVNREIRVEGTTVHVDGGVTLQTLVDFTCGRGLKGLETMTGIPGSVGAAIYGNAGAYGHSIQEIASTCGKGANAVKLMLLRLRGKLRECIEDRMAKGGAV